MHIPLGILAASGGGAAGAFESIATATGTGSSATITFSAIPATFQHLQIRALASSTANTGNIREVSVQINSDTGTNYARHTLIGDGANAFANASATRSNINQQWCPDQSLGSNFFGAAIFDIVDYASTTKNKTLRLFAGGEQNNGSYERIILGSGLWQSTSAITSISFTIDSGNFTAATRFALYGIKGA